MKRIILASLLLAGCGAKQLIQDPAEPSAAPANLSADSETEAEAAPKEAEPGCETAGCEEACAEAGDQLAACAEAFAAGCFSDQPPADNTVCEWNTAERERREAAPAKKEAVSSDADEESAAPSDETPAVRPHEYSD